MAVPLRFLALQQLERQCPRLVMRSAKKKRDEHKAHPVSSYFQSAKNPMSYA
jgi:hypothetical protein